MSAAETLWDEEQQVDEEFDRDAEERAAQEAFLEEMFKEQLGEKVPDEERSVIDPTRIVDGATWLLEEDPTIVPIWGTAERCLWAAGEGTMIAGGQGLGKTTLAHLLIKGRMGLLDSLLGLPVLPGNGRVLYIAADRPRQAQRAMRRIFGPEHREALGDRLRIWKGPLPVDIAKRPEILLEMAQHCDADTIIVDSVKDIAAKLSDDETGSLVNRAWQHCVAHGIELLSLHHNRKATGGTSKSDPKTMDDIYGSTWITSGLGSVIALAGEPGDPVVKLTHLKQPSEVVGPLMVIHDHAAGTVSLDDELDPLTIVRAAGGGLDAAGLARALEGVSDPSKAQVEKARRQLKRLEKAQLVAPHEVENPNGSKPIQVYRAVEGQNMTPTAPAIPAMVGVNRGWNDAF